MDKGTVLRWDLEGKRAPHLAAGGGEGAPTQRLAMHHPTQPEPQPLQQWSIQSVWMPGNRLLDVRPAEGEGADPYFRVYQAKMGFHGHVYFLSVTVPNHKHEWPSSLTFEARTDQTDRLGIIRVAPQTIVFTHAFLTREAASQAMKVAIPPTETARDGTKALSHYIHVLPNSVHTSASPFIGWGHPIVGGLASAAANKPVSEKQRRRLTAT